MSGDASSLKEPRDRFGSGTRGPGLLRLSAEQWDLLVRLVGRRFPEEACGVLLAGRRPDGAAAETVDEVAVGDVVVDEVVECANAASDRRRRYEIAPRELLTLHQRCRAEGSSIAAYWHSHPNGSSSPSEEDRVHAFPGVSFVIVPLERAKGSLRVDRPRSWRLDPTDGTWAEQRVEIEPSDAQSSGAT